MGAIQDNPNHFLVVQVDGDKMSGEVVGGRPFAPCDGRTRLDLRD